MVHGKDVMTGCDSGTTIRNGAGEDVLAKITTLEAQVAALQAAGSGGGSIVVQYGHMNTFSQLADDISTVIWGRDAGGHLDYMNGRFGLPLAPTHGQTIDVFSHNTVGGAGEIVFQYSYSTGQSFHSYSNAETDTYQANNQFAFQNTGRRHYKLHFLVSGNLKEWHMRRVSTDISQAEVATISTNQAAIEKRKYKKYFHHDHANDDYSTTGFQLPDGYEHYSVHYGDSTCVDLNLTYGVCLKLPINPVDMAKVVLQNNNRYSTQNMQSILFVRWNTDGGVPGTRRLVDYGQPPVSASTGQNTVYTFSHSTQRVWTEIIYFLDQDIWLLTNHRST